MKRLVMTTALALLPAAAIAQSNLDRMEAFFEKMNAASVRMIADKMIANGADPAPLYEALPKMDWDDEMRDAGACMLTAYSDKVGEDGVEVMIADMEEFARDIDEMNPPDFTDVTFVPSGITADEDYEIMTSCGMISLQLKRMQDSGLAAAMVSAGQALE